jgi:hypothetical protein
MGVPRCLSEDSFGKLLSPSDVSALTLYMQIPHAFQQRLSLETTPKLCNTIPSFEAMRMKWTNQKAEMPNMAYIIDAGLKKLDDYRERLDLVPAYVGTMSNFNSFLCFQLFDYRFAKLSTLMSSYNGYMSNSPMTYKLSRIAFLNRYVIMANKYL